jgi:hypothetical protein
MLAALEPAHRRFFHTESAGQLSLGQGVLLPIADQQPSDFLGYYKPQPGSAVVPVISARGSGCGVV